MLRSILTTVTLTLALAACDQVVITDTLPTPQGQRQSTVPGGPQPAQRTDRNPFEGLTDARDSRVAAQAFIGVVNTVEPVAEQICRQQAPQLNCDFRIVVDDRPGNPPNAFQTEDEQGRPIIAFTLSLIGSVSNPDELAFILSHEAAHHIQGHLEAQRRNATLGAAIFGQLANQQGASPEAIARAQELGAAVGIRTFSQDFELEADRLGVVITAQAGFDPLEGAEFFLRLPNPSNRFLTTHPPNAERYDAVRAEVRRLGL